MITTEEEETAFSKYIYRSTRDSYSALHNSRHIKRLILEKNTATYLQTMNSIYSAILRS